MKLLLIGQMGSGKDTVADYLKEHYGFHPEKLGRFIRSHVDEMFSELTHAERRVHYQAYGEGMRALFGENFWSERLLAHMDASKENLMITDCRQSHEINFWISRGFIPIAVDADSTVRIMRLTDRDGSNFNAEAFTHSTEISAKKIIDSIKSKRLEGYVLHNNDSLNNLHRQINAVIHNIHKQKESSVLS